MKRRLLPIALLLGIVLALPSPALARWWYGCHEDWCSDGYPPSRAIEIWGAIPPPACTAGQYLGSDNHCHYFNVTGYYSPYYYGGDRYYPWSASVVSDGMYPSFNGSCGPYGYSFDRQCVCQLGYTYINGSCAYRGCPAGYSQEIEGSSCKPDVYRLAERTSCLTTRPCTCPADYRPVANSYCIPY